MEAAIDQHFRERIELARVTFSFKYRALLNKTVGERAIQHCQYFQTVREIRDSTLTAANKEWYEIQRERRLGEEEASAKLSHFVGDRPLQLSRQTAYNTEVSILSGMAKHVGFPAAPDIIGADQQEVDDDLKKMGVRYSSY